MGPRCTLRLSLGVRSIIEQRMFSLEGGERMQSGAQAAGAQHEMREP
jgi:hypothetical protein